MAIATSILESAAIYVLVQMYIWKWQYSHPKVALVIVLLLLLSHVCHHETPHWLGFRVDNLAVAMRESVVWTMPFVLLFVGIGVWTNRIWLIPLRWYAFRRYLRYSLWGLFQEYGLQAFFQNRIAILAPNPLVRSFLNGLIFMSFHFPNPALMVFTFLGGVVFSMLYARHRNLFPLGILHGFLGLLLSNTFPREWLHNMRVGPGYFR